MTKKNIFDSVVFIIVLSLFLYFYFGTQRRHDLLTNGPVSYTIGEITELERGAKVTPWFTYKFHINSNEYEGAYGLAKKPYLSVQLNDSLIDYIGRKYLVKYSLQNIKFHELDLDKPVPDSLINCFKCNWNKPPF
ncbi:hypothetical protein [Croceiramulus getboli]|nr:hypothetical protein P8624_08920 [Flavobacteriaceae bacterium YJPT1-3]